MFALRRALLASVGAVALAASLGLATAANATSTVTDTSIQVNFLHDNCTNEGGVLTPTGPGTIKLTETPRQAPLDSLVVGPLPINVAASTPDPTTHAVIFKGSAGTPTTFQVTETYGVGCTAVVFVKVDGSGNMTPQTPDFAKTIDRVYNPGRVTFVIDPGDTAAGTFALADAPGGLNFVSPDITVAGSTALPGTYSSVSVSFTDVNGAVATDSFQLVVQGFVVSVGPRGDEVNKFGNGFDVFRQNFHAGAVIAGWTATQTDPATDFVRENTNAPGTFRFEAVNGHTGIATGLCVSDPGGGWLSDPLPDGLILTPCNTGNFQKFTQEPDGTLKNWATGLVISPAGTGAQLRGTTAPVPWGGSFYTWTDESSLP